MSQGTEEKQVVQQKISWTQQQIQQQLGYRVPMQVTELMVFPYAFRETGYYVCPRCRITMEREFQSFCDRRPKAGLAGMQIFYFFVI